jgi:hypothetical protein
LERHPWLQYLLLEHDTWRDFVAMDFLLHILHYTSIAFVVAAVALIMTPAAYDRIPKPRIVTAHF